MKTFILILFAVISININAQTKAFDDIYFGMDKKEVKMLSKTSDTLHFGNYAFIISLQSSIFNSDNKLEILALIRYGSIWEKFDGDAFQRLTENIHQSFTDAGFTNIYENPSYNSGVMTEHQLLMIFQNDERTIYVENVGSYFHSSAYTESYHEYFVKIFIMTNECYSKRIDSIKNKNEKTVNDVKNKL